VDAVESKKYSYMNIGTGILLAAITVYGWLNLPDQIAIHFNAAGAADGFADKTSGLLIIPLLFAGLNILFKSIPWIDPLGENIEEFQDTYEKLVIAVLGFMVYIQALIVFWNLEASFTVTQALVPAIAGLYYFMGDVISSAKRNWFVGIRTPWTLSSEEVWDKTHKRCGPLFKIAALITLPALILPDYFIVLTVAPVLAVSLYAVLYSYREYQKQ
jgi:uncharacterized membrane protein